MEAKSQHKGECEEGREREREKLSVIEIGMRDTTEEEEEKEGRENKGEEEDKRGKKEELKDIVS